MADIKVPSNVSSMTFVTSGVKAPTAGVITGITAEEATNLLYDQEYSPILITSAANGNLTLRINPLVTSLTINGNVFAPNGTTGQFGPVAPADGTTYLGNSSIWPLSAPFSLVTG